MCRKYVPSRKPGPQRQQTAKRIVADLPERFETKMLFRSLDLLKPTYHVTLTQKLHGTSVRFGRILVDRELSWWERLAARIGLPITKREYTMVVGSRRVIKSISGKARDGVNHHKSLGEDVWTQATLPMHDQVPEGVVVFAEIIGWVPNTDTPIQPDYTYHLPIGQWQVAIYRIATQTPDGSLYDLPWRAVEQFCERRGWMSVPVIGFAPWGAVGVEGIESMLDVRYHDEGLVPSVLPLSHPTLPDEGLCIRVDRGIEPLILKSKSPAFYVHEGVSVDAGRADMEEEQEAA
jgi:hypothetical protein